MSPGSGLGLSIVKELVELLGGAIPIQDTPGGGATFKLSLPSERTVEKAGASDAHEKVSVG
ncbi:ATP-binding protein [Methylocystis sp. 9N]|uniref:histidine kinase n=1 Tax=Methylocystis borbori TaxID=3118750 RepID=A0ABU7XEX1_9HYPH